MAAPVIDVAHLRKAYGDTVAVDDVSLTVHAGEIVGILGRNGAGKTTTVECLAGLRTPDDGTVRVLGLDPATHGPALREQVALQLQESELPARITVREALDLYASFYAHPADPEGLIADLGLAAAARTRFGRLSGGQKQRVSIALALVGNPRIAILDELTTGLDPQARRETWRLVEAVRDRGVTILLVTHLMEEAERLCDRIVLIDAGRVVATGTPAELAARSGTEAVLRFVPDAPVPAGLLDAVPGVHAVRHPGRDGGVDAERDAGVDAERDAGVDAGVEVRCTDDAVQDVLVALAAAGIRAHRPRLEQRTLEDAFVELTAQPSEV